MQGEARFVRKAQKDIVEEEAWSDPSCRFLLCSEYILSGLGESECLSSTKSWMLLK